MYNILKKIAGHSLFYTLSNSIEAISPFLLAIILTRFLTVEEFGVWVLFIALVTFLRPVVNLTIQDALRMQFFEMDAAERARFVWSSLCLSTIGVTVLAVVALLLAAPLAIAFQFPAQWMVSIPIAAYLYATFYFLLAFNQFSDNRPRFLALHFVQTGASLLLIGALVFSGWGWQGVVIGKIAGLVIGCTVGLFWLVADLGLGALTRHTPQLARLARFGLLYLPTGMGLVAIPLTDRLIITHVLGLAENGLYGVAALFGSAVFVVINGFLHAWMPWLFRALAEWPGNRREIATVSGLFLILLPIGGVVATIVSEFFAPLLIGAAFTDAFAMIVWAIAGTVAMGYFYHNQAFLLYRKAVVPMSVSSVACIALNAVFSYYGALYYGVVGVLAATIGAFLVGAILSATFLLPQYALKPPSRVRL